MAIRPKLPLNDKTFATFKRGVDDSLKATRNLAKLWDKNIEKTFGGLPKDWDDGSVRVNKEFSRVKQKQSLLFFRVPEVQLKPLRPDAEPIAAIAAAALNQVLSKEMKCSYMVDEILTDALCPAGFGVSKISYEAITQKVKVPKAEYQGLAPEIVAGLQETGVETEDEVDVPTYECYDWGRKPYKHFLYPTDFDGSDFDESPWLGLKFAMPGMEAKRQFKLTDKELEGCKVTPGDEDRDSEKQDTVGKVEGYEIWYRACYFDDKVSHKDHFRKLVYLKGVEKPVVHEDSPYQRIENGRVIGVKRYPIRVLSLTYVPDQPIPPSDVTITRPAVAELEKGRTLMMLQRERSLPIRWFDTNQISEEAESLLEDGIVQSWLPMNGPATNAIGEVSRANYPRENFEFNKIIEQDMSEAWALGADQLGQNSPGEQTAREVSERSSASQTRLDYERSKVLRFFREGAEVVFGLLQMFATQPKYAELVGDNGAKALVAWTSQMLQSGDFAFEARPDAALRLDAQADRQQSLNIFSLLANDPMVNRKELLTEVVRTHSMLPEKLVAPQPPEKEPERPSISFRFSGEDMDPTRPSALMVYEILKQSGMELPKELVDQARAQAVRTLALAAQNPAMGLADSMRLDIRADAGAMPGTGAAPTPQPEHPGAVTPVPHLNKTVAGEGRTNQN